VAVAKIAQRKQSIILPKRLFKLDCPELDPSNHAIPVRGVVARGEYFILVRRRFLTDTTFTFVVVPWRVILVVVVRRMCFSHMLN
jgi:hypothetical protein